MNEATSMLPLRSSVVRDVFDLSASNNLMAPLQPISLSVLSKNKQSNKSVTHEIEVCEMNLI
jgi:hypothetical protein